ncbi:hypothetical protein PCANC_20153 [Puccinia coronata f. sp. avenae]|uniref:Trehalase n=1 Tax=Puccinia coronata f. sp. avenae TaxID=200324 RepID=A0A2N5SUK7_9BASI|nr:hypothetical protein PCANC_20153 [Puccinia coronata f. sp. avenae]
MSDLPPDPPETRNSPPPNPPLGGKVTHEKDQVYKEERRLTASSSIWATCKIQLLAYPSSHISIYSSMRLAGFIMMAVLLQSGLDCMVEVGELKNTTEDLDQLDDNMRLIPGQSVAGLATHHESTPSHQTEARPANRARREELEAMMREIRLSWASLVRSNLSLVDLLEDPKLPLKRGEKRKLYVRNLPGSPDTLAAITARLEAENPAGDLLHLEIRELPSHRSFPSLADHGSLYLPFPYVVPGGRFQEMYAWDSFFIALGLLRHNQVRLARNMLDNYIYQDVLPDALAAAVPDASDQASATDGVCGDPASLACAGPCSRRDLPPLLDDGSPPHALHGPQPLLRLRNPRLSPPEIVHETDPRDGSSAHDRVKKFFRQNYHKGIPDYDISEYYDYKTDRLTAKYMDNDRAMRESGFDTSRRFGPFNAKILDFNPVCLNSLLYLMEREIGELYGELEPTEGTDGTELRRRRAGWAGRAAARRRLVQKYNWDEKRGLYFDYDYVTERRREYVFGTTFLPLWTGLAEPAQAARVASGGLAALEIPGGLSTSDVVQGDQWDKPYVWAPLQLFAVDGLRRYALDAPAHRLAANFASTVLKDWRISGSLWEKYNGEKRDHSVALKFGYPTNEPGFGWTNAVTTHFYDLLKAAGKLDDLLLLDGIPVSAAAAETSSTPPNPPPARLLDHSEPSAWVHVATVPPRFS